MTKFILITLVIIVLFGCQEKKELCYSGFTFSTGNIKMCYSLKFNSSDTVYYQNQYYNANKKVLYYFLLEKNEKKMVDSLICSFQFPKDSVLLNDKINDGTTIAFSIDQKRLLLHGNEGPESFWNFEDGMNRFLKYKPLRVTNRKIKFADFSTMIPRVKFEN
jgi:hypothetical protein